MQNAEGSGVSGFLRKMWRLIRWPLAILAVAYVALVAWRIPGYSAEQKSKETVAFIRAQHLTLEDADGRHLPPPPDQAQMDATVAGVDANQNGIRDDVELAIFKKYPNSPYTRAAELQYAMALQNELVNVFDSASLVATLWQETRGYLCIDKAMPNIQDSVFNSRISEIKNLVFNNRVRLNKASEVKLRYMTSHANPSEGFCDVDVSLLSS